MNSAELLTEDQLEAIEWLYQNDQNYLIAKMGAGKSVIALSAMVGLLASEMNTRFLILAPKKVCATVWANEHSEWEDLAHLRVAVVTNNELERQRIFANIEDYDIVVMNYELMPWLTSDTSRIRCFDGLCVDEGSKIGAGGKYFKLLRRHLKGFSWRCVMTGTPVSESHEKLFYQFYAVTDGIIFGRNRQKWLDKYFYPVDYNRRKWKVRPDMEQALIERLKPYVWVVPDYSHELPPLIVQPIFMPMPERAREAYTSMAKKMKAEGVEAVSVGVKMNKLQQISAGFLYSDDEIIELHDEKMHWVEKLTRSEGNHLIIYQYDVEAERLQEAFPDLVIMPSQSDDVAETVAAWNHDEIKRLAIHSRSAGHGLNLAEGGHSIIWMSPVWSNDAFSQCNARLHRRGQTHPVTAVLLLMEGTIESDVVVPRLESKAEIMPAFLAHLNSIDTGARDEPARDRKAYPH